MFRVLRISAAVLALGLLAACGRADTPMTTGARPAEAAPAARPTPPLSTAVPAPLGQGRLAYIQQGDLWTRDLPDGAPRRLTSSGHASAPRWSPSGEWLAYCADDRLHVLRADAAEQRAVGLCDTVAWAPGADRLLHAGAQGLSITTPGTWREQPLPGDTGIWNPDGATLTVSSLRIQTSADGPPQREVELWSVQADGSGALRLAAPAVGASPLLAGWAGARLLFWDSPLLSASLLADGAPLRTGAHALPTTLVYRDFLAASPDGRTLALAAGAGRATWAAKQIVTVDLASGDQRAVTDPESAAVSPAWSPDGRRLAFAAARAAAPDSDQQTAGAALAQRRIWTAAPDGGRARRLTNDPRYRDERPLWSADGASILFARLDQQGRASLWLIGADGSGLALVAEGLSLGQDSPSGPGSYGYIDWGAAFDWQR